MQVKLRAGTQMVPVEVTTEGTNLAFSFGYCPALIEEMRGLDLVGPGWQGYHKTNPRKVWLAKNSPRTRFRLDWLKYNPDESCPNGGKHRWNGLACSQCFKRHPNPYARYDLPLVPFGETHHEHERGRMPYYDHQRDEGLPFAISARQCILAWEPGTGKTIVAGRAMEWAQENLGWGNEDFLYVCKAGALYQVMLDYKEWKIKVHPRFISYEGMRSLVERWPSGVPAPKFVVFDESSQIKSPSSKRSEAALHLANSVRDEHGYDAFILLMTGSPSPKNPADWWMQAEVACPGFVKQGNYNKFKGSLAIIQQVRDDSGGGYPKLVSWLDDERKCKSCGQMADASVHTHEAWLTGQGHSWEKSKDEISAIYKRLRGFVVVKFKKDCLSLPPKTYRRIHCQPSQATLNAARLVAKRARGAAHAMILLRELSDGFQYKDEVIDSKTCPDCAGSGTAIVYIDLSNPDQPTSQEALIKGQLEAILGECPRCRGEGQVDVMERHSVQVPCPKDDVMGELLDEHEDVGRLVTYAGFTGSVDRVVDVHRRLGWSVLRVDGRGWVGLGEGLPTKGKELYEHFRYGQAQFPKLGLVAQASTAAHGLNFDCSPSEVFYSNDFNFESRSQAEERPARGRIAETLKKHNRSSIQIIDIVHLETDVLVLENHARKRKLQAMTMGDLETALSGPQALVEAHRI